MTGGPTGQGALGPGVEIDGFSIEAVAGRGGMGVVYRARQRQPERVVALKVIAADLARDPVSGPASGGSRTTRLRSSTRT